MDVVYVAISVGIVLISIGILFVLIAKAAQIFERD